ITKLRFIRKYSDWQRSERGRELWKKSLRYGLLRLLTLVVLLLGVTAVAGTWLTKSQTWEEAILIDGHTRGVRQAAFSPDGKLLVSVGEDNRVLVWDFKRRMPIATFTDHTDWVLTVAFSPDGKWFATGGKDQRVIIWDAARLQKVTTLD